MLKAKRIEGASQYRDTLFCDLNHENDLLRQAMFSDCRFNRCRLQRAVFSECEFTRCRFINCNLALAQVTDSTFDEVVFTDSKVIGVNWVKANHFQLALQFENCTLDACSFFGLSLKGLRISGSAVREAHFQETDLRKSVLINNDFSGSLFLNANLADCDLRGSANIAIDLHINNLKGAKLSIGQIPALISAFGADIC